MLANHYPAGFIIQDVENVNHCQVRGPVLILIFAHFALGFSLARFGVLAALVATALSITVWLFYYLMNGSTLTQALLLSVFFALMLQVGYLFGQVVRPSKR
jgi:hypothetical protein